MRSRQPASDHPADADDDADEDGEAEAAGGGPRQRHHPATTMGDDGDEKALQCPA